MEKYCPEDFKKYKTISLGGLRAEQIAIKIYRFYREISKINIAIKLINFDCSALRVLCQFGGCNDQQIVGQISKTN